MDNGEKFSLAEHLFKEGVLSLGKAAKVVGMPYVLFSEHLSRLGIAVVDYSADELDISEGNLLLQASAGQRLLDAP